MSLRNHLVLPIIVSTLAVLAGCGGNGVSIANPVAPPNGKFSNSNLSGTYVFSVSGIDPNGAPYSILGTFTANGSGGNGQGGITGGTIDMNDADLSAPVANAAIASSSTYVVGIDGRGRATLNTATPLGRIVLDFVLADSFHGLIIEFDGNATGSGTLDQQTAGAAPSGSYAFIFSGADVSNGSANLFATIGNFTLGAGGAISSGSEDFNDSGFAYAGQTLTGNVVLGPSSTPATTLSTGQFGPQTYDVYAIDATHLKFIEMDAGATLSGDAYSQTSTAVPSGTLAFTLAGSFPGATTSSVAGGFMVTDGSGNITNTSSDDANNGGTVSPSPIAFTGTYTAGGAGRFTLGLANFSDGSAYAAYPSSGGLLLLEIDDSGIMVGAAYPQTSGATFAASQGYALNLSGTNLGTTTGAPAEVDDIAEFTANSGGATVTGVVDENSSAGSGPAYGVALSGTYAAPGSNGRGQIAANAGNTSNSTLLGGFDLTFYPVDGTIFPFIETDSGQVGSGVFVLQNPTAAAPAIAKPHMFVVQPLVRPHAAHWQKK
ncbi:MAG: hypothetical protein WAN76_27190 [Candidatus Sulfotelmatobacter sp.]